MSRVDTQVLGQPTRSLEIAKQAAIVIAASLFVALCARVTVPLLPITPVPLTLQNFGVLTVGLLLGSRRGFAALALYLMEGAFGLPVFSPAILGSGMAHLTGATGGFLMAYPLVAFIAGWIYEQSLKRGSPRFIWAALSSVAAELVLFAGGLKLARRAHAFRFTGAQVWPLLVRFCGSHQGADGRRCRRSLAATDFFAAVN